MQHRRRLRLQEHDYSAPGAYFVTVCTHKKEVILGEIQGETTRLSPAGETVSVCWKEIPIHFRGVELDVFVVMPNHFHGILLITAVVVVGARHTCPDRRCWVPRPYYAATGESRMPEIRCPRSLVPLSQPLLG